MFTQILKKPFRRHVMMLRYNPAKLNISVFFSTLDDRAVPTNLFSAIVDSVLLT